MPSAPWDGLVAGGTAVDAAPGPIAPLCYHQSMGLATHLATRLIIVAGSFAASSYCRVLTSLLGLSTLNRLFPRTA